MQLEPLRAEWKGLRLSSQTDMLSAPHFSAVRCVISGKALNLREPQFPHLSHGKGKHVDSVWQS